MWMTTISYVDGVVPQGSDVRGSGTWVRAVIQLGVRNVFDRVLPTWLLEPEDTERTVVRMEKVGQNLLGIREEAVQLGTVFGKGQLIIQLSRHFDSVTN